MNKIILIGRLTKDPDLRYTPNGAAVCTFTLAVDRPFSGDKKEADFINIVVWNKAGENAAKYLAKGRQAAIEGRLQIRTYDGDDGKKRWATEVVADRVEFIGGAGAQKQEDETFGEEVDFDEGDVPF
nr:MAG TPA: Single strand binding protein [Caudoviricetes sp.]